VESRHRGRPLRELVLTSQRFSNRMDSAVPCHTRVKKHACILSRVDLLIDGCIIPTLHQ
jgi:hypothetical protein